jgi:two-component system LytT family response regulator
MSIEPREAPRVGRVLVVDDEALGRENLCRALAAHPAWALAGECADVPSARAFLDGGTADLVFLDIRMPGESGLQLARELAARPAPPLVVFVTAHDAYAIEAFTVHALDYLLKPIDDERLARALERAAALIAQRQLAAHADALRAWAASGKIGDTPGTGGPYLRQLNVRSVGRIDCVRLEDVRWIEAAGNYVELHLAGRRLLHRIPIGTLERHLDPASFMRVHRRALVRLDQMASLRTAADGSRSVLLRCGSAVPVSERTFGKLRSKLRD